MTISISNHFAKFLLGFVTLLLSAQQSRAAYTESTSCRNIIKLAKKTPCAVSPPTGCPISAALVKWLQLQEQASPAAATAFIKNHAGWPKLNTIRQKVEANIQKGHAATLSWFAANPPQTIKGLSTYIQALGAGNNQNKIDAVIKSTFNTIDFSPATLVDFLKENKTHIKPILIFSKASTLLDKNEASLVKVMLPFLKGRHKDIINIRMQLLEGKPLIIPDSLKNEPSLLFEQVRYYRNSKETDKAVSLLNKIDQRGIVLDPNIIWVERNILGRRLIEEQRFKEAYQLYRHHHLSSGENFANGEWLAGWIALRFLKQPRQAMTHFTHLYENVKSPISVARACYWLGRTHKQQRSKDAKTWFTKAVNYPTTYYGQLARKELNGTIQGLKTCKTIISAKARQRFEARSQVKAIHILHSIGEPHLVESFILALAQELKDPQEQLLLIDLAHAKGGAAAAVQAAKKATKEVDHFIPAAFPRISLKHVNNRVEQALAHAIIRQESRFKHDAVSPAGAMGLMQLMPKTAQYTAKKHKIKTCQLTDATSNTMIGCHHLGDLLERYQGSLILAAAAYNAGSDAVDSWIVQFGDPRDPKVDSVDWVETIPYAETRNYVQRVQENYHCYRCF